MKRPGRLPLSGSTARILFAGFCTSCFCPALQAGDREGRVRVVPVPDGGIQPQAVADDSGVIHVVYFRGEPSRGDLYYVRSDPGAKGFSKPMRVNSQPGSAVAVGTIRGGQLAIGRGGRIHVAWNGTEKATPPNPIKGSPMLYARQSDDRREFEPQRNLMHRTFYLDGGGSIASDRGGNVYVAWHAPSKDTPPGEAGRRLWIARSRNDGVTFAEEEPAVEEITGACACCGTRALVDRRGTLYVLYRAAKQGTERDMILATSRDRGAHFRATSLQAWPISTCPMSSESLFDTSAGVLAAWETKGEIAFSRIDPESLEPSRPVSPPGGGNRKHPAVAANASGETILVWAEDTGWQRGGSLAWRIFDRSGRATRESGRVLDAIPVWSLPAVIARPNGDFVIIH